MISDCSLLTAEIIGVSLLVTNSEKTLNPQGNNIELRNLNYSSRSGKEYLSRKHN
jgi:hypothetical protein